MLNPSAIVIKLPEIFGAKEARKLQRELKNKITNESPNLIADLSRVRKMSVKGLEALLRCLEEVAERDGAVALEAVSPEAATLLELTRVDQILAKFPRFTVDAPSIELTPEPVADEAQEVTVEYQVAV